MGRIEAAMDNIAATLSKGLAVAALSLLTLAGCNNQNKYQPPPVADVTVVKSQQRKVTLYSELTGATAAFNKVDLVARVQGFLEKIGYKDGAKVNKGDLLFKIQPNDYQIALTIAKAAQEQQEALLVQADADLKRKQELVARQSSSVASLDESRAKRDSTYAALAQAKGQVEQAQRNLEYTTIVAPFDGIVSARLADAGAFVGASGPTKLATIVQVDPIYVNFNVDEQQVLRVRQRLSDLGVTIRQLGPIPVEIGLQTEEGYQHSGKIDYIAPEIDRNTGTLPVRAVLDNKNTLFLPGLFVRVRIPIEHDAEAVLAPDIALGTAQQGQYLLVVNDKNIVEERRVEVGDLIDGGLRVIKLGLKPDERVIVGGLQRAVPGNLVNPIEGAATAMQDNP
ncbi:efflux RND transporter periplasmic adaptor subunit [Methylocapsa polymorpha]|uniref:Efflux RND transporter periplasmic adaptor subunit n=1 Tax=Methylocapsa polymorpha TaxID=3080828 RepID=A0ABZ0HSD6_9HYPH|nr:efflux RND transporter periplasmic adaptor subunit [Methylocapsa sp. RX1]